MTRTIEVIKDIRVLCTYTFEGGHQCASPALKREAFCFYHHPNRKLAQKPSRRPRNQPFDIQLPYGPPDLQHAIYEVIRRLAANQISCRRAGILLAALDRACKESRLAPSSLINDGLTRGNT